MAELRTQRRSKNWLHQRSGVARTTIDGWATQPQPPQARTVAAVAEVLKVPEDEALRLAGVLPNTTPPMDDDGWADLSKVSSAALLAEIARRISRSEEPNDESAED